MKKNISLLTAIGISMFLLLANIHLSSCTKTKTIRDTTITIIRDTITVPPPASKLSLLTGKQWIFDSVYSNYTGPGTGTLIYVRGGANNQQNLDNEYNVWTIDNLLLTNNNGAFVSYQWSFLSSDSTTYQAVSTANGTDYGRIIKLDATHLTLYDSTYHALDIDILNP